MDDRTWTLADGVRDVLEFLARRALPAALLWLVLGGLALAWANAGAVASGFSGFGLLIAGVSTIAGFPVGLTLARGLPDAVHFAGWIPVLLAGAAAVLVVVLGWFAARAVLGAENPMLGAFVPLFGGIGALGAVFRCTWAET